MPRRPSRSVAGSRNRPSKNCFIICPIGPEQSEIRKRSDALFKFVYQPVLKTFGYRPIRVDRLGTAGRISAEIVRYLVESPLVLADLSGHNPNVFYELGIRHAVGKPYIQIIEKGESLPFDVADLRSILIDSRDLHSVDSARKELSKQVRAYEDGLETDSIVRSIISSHQNTKPGERFLQLSGAAGRNYAISPLDDTNSRWKNMTVRLDKCRSGETVRFISITGKNFLLPNFQEGETSGSRLGPKALSRGVKLRGLVLDPNGIEADFRSKIESPHANRAHRMLMRDADEVSKLPIHYRQIYGLKMAPNKNLELKYSTIGLSFGLWLFSDVAFVEPFHFGKRRDVPHLCGFAQVMVRKGTEEFDLLEKHFEIVWKNARNVPWRPNKKS